MAIKVHNLTKSELGVPRLSVSFLKPWEVRIEEFVEYDGFVNDSRICRLLKANSLKVEDLDNIDVNYTSTWNSRSKLELGDYQVWVDASGNPRIKDGSPSSDLDGSSFGGSEDYQLVHSDVATINGIGFASVRSSFFDQWIYNRSVGTWDGVYKYCFWRFWWPGLSDWTEARQFATQNDFYSWLEANVPNNGIQYTSIVKIEAYEAINTADVFPKRLVYRNSLVSSILGSGKWLRRRPGQRSGVSTKFNSPSYYLNYYGELAQRLVQSDFGVLPATNNDGAIWHTAKSRSAWGLPKVGSVVNISSAPNLRGAVWDNGLVDWVAPAPQDSYTVQTPMLLYEYRKDRLLSIDDVPGTSWRAYAMNAVSALVFPVQRSSNVNQHAYVIYPHGVDSFSTERFDLVQYELVLKLEYRGVWGSIYVNLPTPYSNNDGEHLMWSTFPLGGGISLLLQRQAGGSQYYSNPDTNVIPSKVWVARRNKATGSRSKWYPLYTIKRRIPHATFRVEPSKPRV